MLISKSKGTTRTEQLLTQLSDSLFLYLWSYSNPYNEEQKELCDLLAVFENHVFIFFDRENRLPNNNDKDPQIHWERWKRKVIEPQIRTANGAERYIRNGGNIYLDKDKKQLFPIPIDRTNMVVHKIIVAHGAKEACLNQSRQNVYGSLAISYSAEKENQLHFPFFVDLDKNKPVHIFDSHNLPIIFNELNTFFDFSSYLDAKLAAITKYDFLTYCGEEDLLANYFLNYDENTNKHFIGTEDNNINGLYIAEGEWKNFIESNVYKRKKQADNVSYLWDELIQRTCKNALKGVVGGNSDMFGGKSAIIEMAKEPRFMRRTISERMIQSINNFPESNGEIVRNLVLLPSFYKGKAYVFLQLKVTHKNDYENDYRPKRQAMLEIACGAAKNKFNEFNKIIGIAIDAPKYSKINSEDFLLLDCLEWTEDNRTYYKKANEGLNFFNTPGLRFEKRRSVEFPKQ